MIFATGSVAWIYKRTALRKGRSRASATLTSSFDHGVPAGSLAVWSSSSRASTPTAGTTGGSPSSLSPRGLAVYAVDLRGRGKSDGERFYVQEFADYVSDAAGLVALAKSREPGLPVFLLGHSAGGVVACIYALDHQAELAGLICESFAFQVPAPDFALAVLKGLSHIAPHAHVLHAQERGFLPRSEGRGRDERRSADRPRDATDADGRGDGACRRAAQEGVSAHHPAGADPSRQPTRRRSRAGARPSTTRPVPPTRR